MAAYVSSSSLLLALRAFVVAVYSGQVDVCEWQDRVITAIRDALTQGGIELYNPNA